LKNNKERIWPEIRGLTGPAAKVSSILIQCTPELKLRCEDNFGHGVWSTNRGRRSSRAIMGKHVLIIATRGPGHRGEDLGGDPAGIMSVGEVHLVMAVRPSAPLPEWRFAMPFNA